MIIAIQANLILWIILGVLTGVLVVVSFFLWLEIYKRKKSMNQVDYFSRLTHDLKTPIYAIKGYTLLANQSLENQEKLQEHLNKIANISEHLESLVKDIIDVSSLRNHKVKIVKTKVDLKEVLNQCINNIEPQMLKRNIHFEYRINIEHGLVEVDALHLNQILTNLLSNAVKYTESEGKILLDVEEQTLQENHSTFIFKIQDTGYGMSEEFQKKAFKPFAQERSFAHTDTASSGLGLFIVKELTERMGGRISLQSEVSVGSCFTITLNLERFEEEKLNFDINNLKGKKVLLAEDNLVNVEIICNILKSAFIDVEVVHNGNEAIKAFLDSKENEFDCILMDFYMPQISGFEASQKIRASDRDDGKTIPIIGITAVDFEKQIKKSKNCGLNLCLSKPIQAVKLLNSLNATIK